MKNLFQIELIKTLNNTAFRTFTILHLLMFSLVVFTFSQIHFSVPGFSMHRFFNFPYVWSSMAWVASWFNILLTILVIVLVGNEFTFKMFRQQVVRGLGREDLLISKIITILLIALYSFALVCFSSLIYGVIFTREFSLQDFFSGMDVMFIYFYQAIAYMILGLLFIVLFRNTAIAIVLFFSYRLILEPILRLMANKEIRPYFPMKMISNLTPLPELLTLASRKEMVDAGGNSKLDFEALGVGQEYLPVWENVVLVTGYMGAFIAIIYLLLKKRDL